MKASKEQAARNKERVLEVASEQYREHGFGGIGVADVMRKAGMTHGAFYGQFESKEDLMAQACARSFKGLAIRWGAVPGQASWSKVASFYLTPAHAAAPGAGCVVAALGSEASRMGPAVTSAIAEGVEGQIMALAGLAEEGEPAEISRARAIEAYASMVGAMVLTRAVGVGALSDEVLAAVAARVGRLDGGAREG